MVLVTGGIGIVPIAAMARQVRELGIDYGELLGALLPGTQVYACGPESLLHALERLVAA